MLNKKKLIPVSLLTGYLGSGKTTLLNQVLSNQKGYKVAVIVNDIGEVNIDASLIQKGGNVTQKDENLVPLSNGCICCTLKVDLMKQIISFAQSKKFDYTALRGQAPEGHHRDVPADGRREDQDVRNRLRFRRGL